MNRGDKIKLIARGEWPHFRNKPGLVAKIIERKGELKGVIIALRSQGETIRLLRTPEEIEITESIKQNTLITIQKGDFQNKMATQNNGFERFLLPSHSNLKPRASLIGKGMLAFNSGACALHKLFDFKYYVAFYNKANKQIGIKFTNDEKEPGARSFGKKKQNYIHLAFGPFLEYYKIPADPKQYTITVADDGMLILDEVAKA